jgi:hypothetical protein
VTSYHVALHLLSTAVAPFFLTRHRTEQNAEGRIEFDVWQACHYLSTPRIYEQNAVGTSGSDAVLRLLGQALREKS